MRADVARRNTWQHRRADRYGPIGATWAPMWCDDIIRLIVWAHGYTGLTVEVGGGTYKACCGDTKGYRPSSFYTRQFHLIFSVWDYVFLSLLQVTWRIEKPLISCTKQRALIRRISVRLILIIRT